MFLFQTSRDSSTEKLLQKLNGWYMEKEGTFFTLLCIILNLNVNDLIKQYKSGFTLYDFMCFARNILNWFYWFVLLWCKLHNSLFLSITLKNSKYQRLFFFLLLFRTHLQDLLCFDYSCYWTIQSWCVEEPCQRSFAFGISRHAWNCWWGEIRKRRM